MELVEGREVGGIVKGSKFYETLPPEKIEGIVSVEFYPT
jgi:hypothetical protein